MQDRVAELNAWLREESSLVSFARSLRMEGESANPDVTGDNQQGQQQQQGQQSEDDLPDPYAGIDLDNLPDDIRSSIEAKQKEFAIKQTAVKQQLNEAKQVKQLAREHQSRADRFHSILTRHNLIDANGRPIAANGESALPRNDEVINKLTAKFEKRGMKTDVARAYADMFADMLPIVSELTSREVGEALQPVFNTVGNLAGDKVLVEAMSETNDPEGYLQVPEIQTEVRNSLNQLSKQGQTVTLDVIETLKQMGYGKYMMDKAKKGQPQVISIPQQPRFNTRAPAGVGGSFAQLPNLQRGGGSNIPIPANEETDRAVQSTIAIMLNGTGIKKKGAK